MVVGGFGVGKTTMVRSVSEIRPLNTEETMTQAGEAIDDLDGVQAKTTTTVAFDFGRITLDDAHRCSTCSARPGRSGSGSCGTGCSPARSARSSWWTPAGWPTPGTPSTAWSTTARRSSWPATTSAARSHTEQQIREALDLAADVPLVDCDARDRASSKYVLITLVEHLPRCPPPA